VKLRSGIYFASAVILVLLGWYAANELYARWVILPRKYAPLQPGKVNLIGLRIPGYRIVVSNGVARLEQGGSNGFGKPEESPEVGASGAVISMKALLGTLRYDEGSASELTTALAGIKTEIEPLPELTWSEEHLVKALAGDDALTPKLERDLCTRLDGSGLDAVNWKRLNTGIWIELRVALSVPLAKAVVSATLRVPYQTRLASLTTSEVNKRLTGGRLEPDRAMLAAIYQQSSTRMAGPGREVVADSLRGLVSEGHKRKLAEPVEALLAGVDILATESQITDASLSGEDSPDGTGKVYTLTLGLTGESRDRIWQYTFGRIGGQLMLVSNDIAIAAPFIREEIKYPTVTITNIADEDLAREALDFIKARAKQP